jgi:hypothetical protein
MRYTLEPVQVAAHVLDGARCGGIITSAVAEELDPSRQARQGRCQLVRRLARHPCPHSLAIGAAPRAQHVDASEKHECHEQRLQHGNEAKALDEARVAEVDRADRRLYQGRILAIEHRDVGAHARVLHGTGLKGKIDCPDRTAACVGDDDGYAKLADGARQIEQRGVRRIGAGVRQRAQNLGVHPTRS